MSIVSRVLGIDKDAPSPRGPRRVYAIVERIPAEKEPDDRLVFQGIEANWFDEMPDTEGTVELPDFIGARFFIIKIGKDIAARFQQVLSAAKNDNADVWFQIDFSSPKKCSADPAKARIYEDAEKPAWNLRISNIAVSNVATQKKLKTVFRLPDQWKSDAKLAMMRFSSLVDPFVVAYDVGQGAANGIHAQQGWVEAYFDFGGGTTTHAKTFPQDLRFCFTQKPLIILSHWHADHWISASKHDLRALEADWIVPDQALGPSDVALALAIQHKGGTVTVIPYSSGTISVGPITIGCCSGSNRNESGLAVLVRTNRGEVLLPGDCGYEHLPDFWIGTTTPPKLVGLAAPHHGGLTSPQITKPLPGPLGVESKLAYSFGEKNRYRHARPETEAMHVAAGWTQAMTRKTPTLRKTQGHILLTPDPIKTLPCKAWCPQTHCTLEPSQ